MIVHLISQPARNTTKLSWLLFRTCGPLLESGSGQQKLVPACCLMHTQHSSSAGQPARGLAFDNARLHAKSHNAQEKTVSAEAPSLEPPEAVEGTTASQHVDARPPPREVAILWDLDNVRPNGPVVEAVRELRRLATAHGDVVVEFCAAASRHAFDDVPAHVLEERARRRELDRAEDSGQVPAREEPYHCPFCGAKCKTSKLLKKHYRRLHERQLAKELTHLKLVRKKSGKKAEKFLQKRGRDIARRTAVHHEVMGHEKGYGLKSQLELAGVKVKVVSDEPQSADKALEQLWASLAGTKRQVGTNSLSALVLVSDDSDFHRVLASAKKHGIWTIVVGENSGGKLAQRACEWVSWSHSVSGITVGAFEPQDDEV